MSAKVKILDTIVSSRWMSIVLCMLSIILISILLHTQGLSQLLKLAGPLIILYASVFILRLKKVRQENKLLSPVQLEIKLVKEKEIRRNIWLGSYFLLYAYLSFFVTEDSATPQWLIAFEYAFSFGALLCIVLYALRIRPGVFNLIWQIFPVCLVTFDIYDLIYSWMQYAQPQHFPVWAVISFFMVAFLLNAPSWYISFRLGYPRDDDADDAVFSPDT